MDEKTKRCPSCNDLMVRWKTRCDYSFGGQASTEITWLCTNGVHGLTRVTATELLDGIHVEEAPHA